MKCIVSGPGCTRRRVFFCRRAAASAPMSAPNSFKPALALDAAAIARSVKRIAHEIVERNGGAANLVLIGIVRRGARLAERLAGAHGRGRQARGPGRHARHLLVSRRRPGRARRSAPARPRHSVLARWRTGGAGRRRALHRPHRARRARRAGGSGASRIDSARGAGRSRRARAADSRRLRRPEISRPRPASGFTCG